MRVRWLALLLSVSGIGFTQDTGTEWITERKEWEGTVKPGQPIEIHNDYGDVRARGIDGTNISLTAMVQKHEDDAHSISFDIEQRPDRLVVRMKYEGDDGETAKAGGKRRADVSVLLPQGCPYTVRTVPGLIEVKGFRGDVDLYSQQGNIFLRNHGHAKVGTNQGNVDATLLDPSWIKPLSFESTIGNISVRLPSNADVTVDASTAGELTSDYSIDIERDPHTWEKRARAVIGSGQSKLVIASKSGNIKILEGKWDVDH